MTDHWMERLSEYLDNELPDEVRAELERHLAGCEACRRTLGQLEAVVARSARLTDREPRADLWAGVREVMDRSRMVDLDSRRRPVRRFSFSLSQLVAAAAALVILSGGAVWLVSSGGSGPGSIATGTTEQILRPVSTGTFDPRGRADSAITELERVLAEESGRLDSSTVRILSENLALIDRAIGQARKALDADPNNPYLNDHLARTMRKKIEVLRRAADLAQVAS
jgi:anti-sigma factor RsiW